MPFTQIKFGTDGWRAVIADTYTFENVQHVAQATGNWLRKHYDRPSAVVGYDTRFLGARFAQRAAQTLASMGIHVRLAGSVVPTPAVSWAAQAYGCSAGVVITASHNPFEYNGFKIKSEFGGPALPEQIAQVEAELHRLDPSELTLQPFDALRESGTVEMVSLYGDYLNLLRGRIDLDAIRASGLRIAHDAMHGAGRGVVQALLGAQVVPLHYEDNPGFGGVAPEPIERNLDELAETVVRERCDVGLANDGDADRIGLYDERGRFVDSHRILALLLRYLYKNKGERGSIVRTFSTTDMLTKMAGRYGLPIHTTKIGFKYIAPKILNGDVLIGGEESGGIAVKGHVPERDGLYIGLLVVELMVKRGKKLSELVRELFDEFGPHFYYRDDLHTTEEKKRAFMQRLAREGLDEVAGLAVEAREDLDGFKFRTTDGPWVMIRPSGTEPVLRVYAEADTPETARALVEAVVDLL